MHKTESVKENETHKVLKDFEIQTDHQILGRQSDLVIINKKKGMYRMVDFADPADNRIKLKKVFKK